MTGRANSTMASGVAPLAVDSSSPESAMHDPLLSIEEAARWLGGVSKWTVEAWLSKGRLRRTKVGRRTMIRVSELERFLAACAERKPNSIEDSRSPQR